MTSTLRKRIAEYRKDTYHHQPDHRLQTKDEAVDFIEDRGFLLFHPAKNIEFPSLWEAKAGDRPVPNEHDDPGHITWQWKDDLLGERRCYYGRLLAKKMSFVSLQYLPFFFRLGRCFDFEYDYLYLYEKGEMSYEAKAIYEVLLSDGPMDTLQVRKKAGLWGRENQYRYTKSLNWLQTELMVVPVGIAEVGRWNYAFILDILPRYYSELPAQSLLFSQQESRERIFRKYLLSLGASDERNAWKVLRWSKNDLQDIILHLQEEKFLEVGVKIDSSTKTSIVLRKLLL